MNKFTPSDDEVARIERATAAAVPSQVQAEVAGWLVAVDPGTVGRARSAVPLSHAVPAPEALGMIEPLYRERGLAPMLRLPRIGAFEALRGHVAARGFAGSKPTLVQVASTQDVAAAPMTAHVTVSTGPDDDWCAMFLGPGFDPVDAASRLEILRRGRDSLFATARVDGEVAAVGAASFAHGWCGVHGMRTAPAFRGRGLAQQVLATLAQQAHARGVPRVFLQVEEVNAPARSLYRRAGFGDAWAYEYWTAAR